MGLALRSRNNVDEVLGKLDAWVADVANVAGPRALKALAEQAQVAGLRKINEIYRIGPRTFEKYVDTAIAANDLRAVITAKGSGFPLYLFSPRPAKPRAKGSRGRAYAQGGGVTITLKGRRVLIPHSFIAQMKSGHIGVFARGAYGGKGKQDFTGERSGRFQFGRRRYSINELFTFGAPQAFSNPEVTEAMNERVRAQFGPVMAHEIRFASR